MENILEETKNIMRRYNIKPNKSLGQNFLINSEVVENIVQSSDITKDDMVIEIGPGLGVLTKYLLEKAKKVVCIELDTKMVKILQDRFSEYDNIEIINTDVLKINLNEIIEKNKGEIRKVKVVANLPYYITTPIIMKLIEDRLDIESITVMIQKEVADRLIEIPGGKNTGAITYTVYYYCTSKKIMEVPNTSFIPEPEVTSEIIKMDLRYKPVVDVENGTTKKVKISTLLTALVEKNAGAHNSIYRGKDITDLFYDGTLSKQIAAGTFDDIFVGDYIIGKTSGRKYLVADINYRLHMGDTECTKLHVLMIPERIMGTAQMNASNITDGAYIGSAMYKTNLAQFKTVIKNDFETSHILKHRNLLQNAVSNGCETGGTWYDSDIELMNEIMVYGCQIFKNATNGSTFPNNYQIDNSQLSLFRLRHDSIVARNDAGDRYWYWLRDVVSSTSFASVSYRGYSGYSSASNVGGVRPAFLIV